MYRLWKVKHCRMEKSLNRVHIVTLINFQYFLCVRFPKGSSCAGHSSTYCFLASLSEKLRRSFLVAGNQNDPVTSANSTPTCTTPVPAFVSQPLESVWKLWHIIHYNLTSIKTNTVQQCLVPSGHDGSDELNFRFQMPLTESRLVSWFKP